MHRLAAWLAWLGVLPCSIQAAPYIPKDDAVVVARMPAPSVQSDLLALRAQSRARPQDPLSAFALAERYLEIGRADSDPRFISYAQATLTPWVNRPTPPAQALVLEAIAVQFLHRFDEARELLKRALLLDPANAQAWLTQASLLQVQGDLQAARESCRSLLSLTDRIVALACLTSVDSSLGQLAPSYQRMSALLPATQNHAPAIRVWILAQLADMATRLGDQALAAQHLQTALAIDPGSALAKGMYADVLLERQQWSAVRDLLQEDAANDALLVRLSIATRRLDSDAEQFAAIYDARLQAVRQRGDGDTHLREHARFMLDVRGDAKSAVALAARNFEIQREPQDIRLLIRAAQLSGRWDHAAAALGWIREHNYEDAQISAALSEHPDRRKP
jgi:tetratricopeptide (TPR) repeat protein